MLPGVQINALNRRQGQTNEIERVCLFVGIGSQNVNKLISLATDTDLDALFGEQSSEIKRQVNAAKLNAGQNWFAYAYLMPEDEFNFATAVREANETAAFEYCVNTYTIGIDKNAITALQSLYAELLAKYSRRTFFIQAIAGNDGAETWEQYVARLTTLQAGIAAEHVMLVPNLFGNDVGVLAGRLANRSVTIADSPARVQTGALVELGSEERPTDNDSKLLTMAHIQALEKARYSTVMWYPDYDGFYWSDGRTLDVEGGDYQVIEHVRVVDKVCRRVRLLAIPKIADRSFNNTGSSIEAHQTLFATPMREMAKSVQIGAQLFPGECYPPTDDSVVIQWLNKNQVNIYIKVQPMECPKQITANVFLDLNLTGA
ncbi:phage tail protein [[Actinobacillus] muris]|uniref:Phage tail protein n=1 Tax=Muribacter muris TaxID=67855 RepID=A0A0J5P6T4_9PAST|nr:DUF2586 domain-containing protein [Muribacter muris]KMK51475.1 phage tail protein [[Actinobacillus] muris] [Muribacter muris]